MNPCAIWDVILCHLPYTTFAVIYLYSLFISCYLHCTIPGSLFFDKLCIWSFNSCWKMQLLDPNKTLLLQTRSSSKSNQFTSLVINLSSLHTSLSRGQTWSFMEKHCTKGAFTATYHWPLAITVDSCSARTKKKMVHQCPG